MKKLLFTAALGFLTVFANSSSLVNANLNQFKLTTNNNLTKNLKENNAEEEPIGVKTEDEIRKALETDKDIYMENDITINGENYLNIFTSYKVNFDLNGHVLRASSNPRIGMFTVSDNAELTLSDSNPTVEHRGTIDKTTGLWTYDDKGDDIIKGGIITGVTCQDAASGGYAVKCSGTFEMNGGTIAGNKAENTAQGAVCIVGSNASFTMNGGSISNNVSLTRVGGVQVTNGASFIMNDGEITANYAKLDSGGVSIASSDRDNPRTSFTMNGGIIANNVVTEGNDGVGAAGVQISLSTFTMNGGIISGNKSPFNGAGIYVDGWDPNYGYFTMNGGKIIDNEVTNSSYFGGGIYAGNFSIVKFGDSAYVQDNKVNGKINNVYLPKNKYLTIDSPEQSMLVGVTTCETPTAQSPVQFTSDASEGYENYFSSDNEQCIVKYNSGHLELGYAGPVEKIAIETMPTKVVYTLGEELDLSGGKLAVTYGDDKTFSVAITNSMVTGYDKNKIGEQELTVTYAEKTATFNVTVIDIVTRITLKSGPDKTKYKLGEDLDLTGAKITATHISGKSEEIPVDSGMVSGYNKDKIGTQTVTVTYEEKTTSFDVTVVDNPSPTPGGDSGLSAGLIAAIVGGSAVGLGGLIWLIVVLAKKKKKKPDSEAKKTGKKK